MDEQKLVEKINNTWIAFKVHLDAFALYADLVKPDLSGLKKPEEINPKNVQIKDGIIQYLKGYRYAVELRTLCDLYLEQFTPEGYTERIPHVRQLAENYSTSAESKIRLLIKMALKKAD